MKMSMSEQHSPLTDRITNAHWILIDIGMFDLRMKSEFNVSGAFRLVASLISPRSELTRSASAARLTHLFHSFSRRGATAARVQRFAVRLRSAEGIQNIGEKPNDGGKAVQQLSRRLVDLWASDCNCFRRRQYAIDFVTRVLHFPSHKTFFADSFPAARFILFHFFSPCFCRLSAAEAAKAGERSVSSSPRSSAQLLNQLISHPFLSHQETILRLTSLPFTFSESLSSHFSDPVKLENRLMNDLRRTPSSAQPMHENARTQLTGGRSGYVFASP